MQTSKEMSAYLPAAVMLALLMAMQASNCLCSLALLCWPAKHGAVSFNQLSSSRCALLALDFVKHGSKLLLHASCVTIMPHFVGLFPAAKCCPPEDDRIWTGSGGKQLTALQIAIEHGHTAAGEAILKAAVKAGYDMTSAAVERVCRCYTELHQSESSGPVATPWAASTCSRTEYLLSTKRTPA